MASGSDCCRVERCWGDVAEAAANTERSIAVVTHGLVCYSLALRLLGLPEEIIALGQTHHA